MSNWVDISNYTKDVTPAQAQGLKSAGYDGVVVGLQYPNNIGYAHTQIPTCATAGLRIQCYAESQNIWDVWPRVSAFVSTIERIWQACEENFITEYYLDTALAFIDGLHLREDAGIYTAPWWEGNRPWMAKYGQTRDLWLADYDGHPDPAAYWARWRMWQYSGSTTVAGVGPVDLNEMIDLEVPVNDNQKRWLTSLVNTSVIVLSGGDVRDLSPDDKAALKELSDAAQTPY